MHSAPLKVRQNATEQYARWTYRCVRVCVRAYASAERYTDSVTSGECVRVYVPKIVQIEAQATKQPERSADQAKNANAEISFRSFRANLDRFPYVDGPQKTVPDRRNHRVHRFAVSFSIPGGFSM